MKPFLTFLVLCLIITSGYAQHLITVDFATHTDTLKDLMGVNRFSTAHEMGYVESGVSTVRLHDNRESDYCNYSDFWDYDPDTDTFVSINAAFNPADPGQYNWTDLDALIQGLDMNDLNIYFRLGISWPDNPFYTPGPIDPPLDADGLYFTNFAQLCKYTVMHYNDSWADGHHYGIEYWEVWNEPDNAVFWSGTGLEYKVMYREVATTLKTYDPELKVGASGVTPSTIVTNDPLYYVHFLQYVVDNSIPLDFFSWHLYGAKNPYGIKWWAEDVRHKLDSLGLTNTESHITEINDDLSDAEATLADNAAGASYLLSNLMTLQSASVDKVFWYPGEALANEDVAGAADLKWNGYGMKTYDLMYDNTPLVIPSTGDLVVSGNWESHVTNLMTLAGKSLVGDKVYLAISNYNSDVSDFEIDFINLPFAGGGPLRVTINKVKSPSDKFSESSFIVPGGSVLSIPVSDMPSPSIILIRIEPLMAIAGTEEAEAHFAIYPNPAAQNLVIEVPETNHAKVQFFTMKGEEVKALTLTESKTIIDVSDLERGTYLVRLLALGEETVRTIVLD